MKTPDSQRKLQLSHPATEINTQLPRKIEGDKKANFYPERENPQAQVSQSAEAKHAISLSIPETPKDIISARN